MSEIRLIPPVEEDLWFVPRAGWADRLRDDALMLAQAAIDAADPAPLVTGALATLPITGDRVLIIAAGKAAAPMAAAAVETLDGTAMHGVVVTPARAGGPVAGLDALEAGHPLPDASSEAAAREVARLLGDAGPADAVLLLLSGGASALLALPAGDVTMEDYAAVTALLLAHGADIHTLNTVRKHVDALKGGHLARMAAPARVHALILSDVIGDPVDTIASGPVSPDPTTYADAMRALHDAAAWAGTPERVRRHLERGAAGEYAETPKPGDALFDGVAARVVGNNALAREGAAERARALGYEVVMIDEPIAGAARDAGGAFARRALALRAASPRRVALIGGGETTVEVRGAGRGGRNQEVALGAAVELAGSTNVLIGSFGTDGIDGPTSVAGAVADGDSVGRASERGLQAQACLDDNDAFGFFGCLHDLLLTGPTGTNVLDVQFALVDAVSPPASP